LFRALAGLARAKAGGIELGGRVAFIPEDRTAEAMIGEFTLTENLVLSQGGSATWIRGPWVRWDKARARAAELIATFSVNASGPEALANSLSGGNQQRVVIGEALETKPSVLLAENPTRGLDFKASQEVMDRLRGAAESGVAVLVHLPDLDDLLGLATRIVVLSRGHLIEVPAGASRDEIGRRMLGVDSA
jgi:simple sugar transport system ATP-binding protein